MVGWLIAMQRLSGVFAAVLRDLQKGLQDGKEYERTECSPWPSMSDTTLGCVNSA